MQEYEAVVIGGGPAGLTAGLYLSRYGLKTAVIERGLFGGQIVNAARVDNYPGFPDGISGMDLGQLMHTQSSKYGLECIIGDVTEVRRIGPVFQVTTYDDVLSSKAIIIATGSAYRKLGIDGEERLNGRGISYCATCDGFLFKNKVVAVVGGGDTAVTDAIELSQNCKNVYVIHRRDQLRASDIVQRAAFATQNIKFIWNSLVIAIEGQEKLKSLKLKNIKSGETATLEVDGLFIAVGIISNSGIFKELVEIDESGNIITDETMCTKTRGVFAAGDIRKNSARQVAAAVGDGTVAAKSAFTYIKEVA